VRAIDTNVVVRFVVQDDADQSARAKAIVEEGPVFVSTTVILESEWVLRSTYGYSAERIVRAFEVFLGVPSVILEDPTLVAQALDWTLGGMDFADALHLGSAQGCSEFVSFDRKLARVAGSLSDLKVIAP
jgi:predicted nucleic-acid-binding protein